MNTTKWEDLKHKATAQVNKDYSKFYKKIYEEQDPNPEGPHGWIQWKGTEVCIDIHCQCGAHMHFDGDFMYYVQCPHCLQVYAAGQNIKLIPLSAEDLALGGIPAYDGAVRVAEPDERFIEVATDEGAE